MDAFLRACLRWLHTDPDNVVAELAPVWPAERPRGRPSAQSAGEPSSVPARRREGGSGHTPPALGTDPGFRGTGR